MYKLFSHTQFNVTAASPLDQNVTITVVVTHWEMEITMVQIWETNILRQHI